MQYKAGKIVAFSCLAQQSSAQSESCVFTSRSAQKFLGNRGSGGKTDHFQVTRHGYSWVFLPEACLLTCWLALPQSRQGNATFCSQVLCSRLKRQTQGWEVARGLVSKFPMAASFLLTTNRQESGPVSHGQNSCCVWSFEKPQNYAVVKASRVGKPAWLGEGGDWGFYQRGILSLASQTACFGLSPTPGCCRLNGCPSIHSSYTMCSRCTQGFFWNTLNSYPYFPYHLCKAAPPF